MAVFKCKMCGGDLEIIEDSKVAECGYCGTKQTVPSIDNEKKLNLFNRANRLRMNSEFDKAASLYENIIAEFPEEAEAYWGLCLCNYGIEYVDDPATGRKIPTCHRASFEKLQNDENYELAMEYGDLSAQALYRAEAREIDRIMDEILSISKNEEPYDVFICYKETDSRTGERTIDSVLAYDIYEALTARGLKVFFARVTLEEKLGRQYEPYIFAALNSAKVMLAVGTKYEYFNAVWVKNEWSRFLKLIRKDKSKVLIPCFKDIDPYDIPDEFKSLQAQDMSKLGFMQDLVRGVEKLIAKDVQHAQNKTDTMHDNAPAENFIKRANMFIAAGDFANAEIYFNKALDLEPDNVNATLGLLLAECEVTSEDELQQCEEAPEKSVYYKILMNIAAQELKDKLTESNRAIILRKEEKANEKKYKEASELMNSALSEADFIRAGEIFSQITDYKDSGYLSEKCRTEWSVRVASAENALSILVSRQASVDKKEKLEALIKTESETKKKKSEFEAVSQVITVLTNEKEKLKAELQVIMESSSSHGLFFTNKKKQDAQKIEKYQQRIEELSNELFAKNAERKELVGRNFDEELMVIRTEISEIKEQINKEKEESLANAEDIKGAQELLLCYQYFSIVSDRKELIRILADDKDFLLSFLTTYGNGHPDIKLSQILSDSLISQTIVGWFPLMRAVFGNKNLFNLLPVKTRLHIKIKLNAPVTLGSYPQYDGKSRQAVEWIVLSSNDKQALLLSKYCLDCQPFNSSRENYVVHWANSDIRKWLNTQFFNSAFTAEEKTAVYSASLPNSPGPDRGSNGGNNTVDKVFLLSCNEIVTYLKESPLRKGFLTKYAQSNYPEMVEGNKHVGWWLRTSGDGVCSAYITIGPSEKKVTYSDPTAELYAKMATPNECNLYGNLAYKRNAVRPAILVDISV